MYNDELKRIKNILCFGCNERGELGTGDNEEVFLPKEHKLLKELKIIKLSTGFRHSLALSSN